MTPWPRLAILQPDDMCQKSVTMSRYFYLYGYMRNAKGLAIGKNRA